MTVTIEITQEDIDNGRPINPVFCPVALAFRRMGYDSISVGGLGFASFLDKGGSVVYLNGGVAAIDFIRKFDRGERVQPVTLAFVQE